MSGRRKIPPVHDISIVGFGSYMPEKEVGPDFFLDGEEDRLAKSPLLSLPQTRRHVAREERAAQMVEQAARSMFERLGIEPQGSVDLVITNVLLPDIPITGCGEEVSALLDIAPEWVIDLHNGGCAAFPYMLKLTQAIMSGAGARSALLCNVQNTAGQVFAQPDVRGERHAALAGDGCGVAYVVAGDTSPVLAVETLNDPRSAADMGLALADGRKYWEPGRSQIDIKFADGKAKEIVERGNTMVPEVISRACEKAGISTGDVDVLITNQPNRLFLRAWRQALDVPPERHLDTFDRFGNLYGAGVPVTFAHALREGRIKDDDVVALGGFAHAGDFAAAAVLRWNGGAAEG